MTRSPLRQGFLSVLALLATLVHQVAFKHPGLADLEVGRIDFATTREMVAHWPEGATP